MDDPQTVRFFYIRDQRRCPIAVVAYRTNWAEQVVEFGVATHNPADEWDRDLGKQIATGRLDRSPHGALFIDMPSYAVRSAMLGMSVTPSRVRRAIRAGMSGGQLV